MRLDGPGRRRGIGKRGVGAHFAVGACAGRRSGRSESLDCAQRIGRVRGRGSAARGQRGVARFRLGGERGHDRAALFKPRLPGRHFAHLALEGIPLEHLPARGGVELRARLRQTILVSRPHLRLMGEDCAHEIVVEGDVKRDGSGPGEGEQRERRDRPDARRRQPHGADSLAPRERKAIGRRGARIALSQRHEPRSSPAKRAFSSPEQSALRLMHRKIVLGDRESRRSGGQSAFVAARTSSAWPGTFTLRQILAMRPFGPRRERLSARRRNICARTCSFPSTPHRPRSRRAPGRRRARS